MAKLGGGSEVRTVQVADSLTGDRHTHTHTVGGWVGVLTALTFFSTDSWETGGKVVAVVVVAVVAH